MARKIPVAELVEALQAIERYGSLSKAAIHLNIPRSTLQGRYNHAIRQKIDIKSSLKSEPPKETKKLTESGDTLTIDYRGVAIKTPEELLIDAEIDMAVWEVAEVVINNWEVAGKRNRGQVVEHDDNNKRHTRWLPEDLWKTSLRQIRIRLRRKSSEQRTLEKLLELLAKSSPIVPVIPRAKPHRGAKQRCLEISLMDPHYGMQCFAPGADLPWSQDDCRKICMWAVDSLLQQAEKFAPVDSIIFPFGNDFLHVDNMHHETSGGTTMGDATNYHHMYAGGEDLAIAMIERLKKVAPVKVLEIPGNHDRQSAYTLGRLLRAYYRNDVNVEVDASASPYKFHRYGTNLIGFEHGHSIPPIRLAGLMANERPADWAETSYREWHLGDQHRKGSSKPCTMEEQGVSVEYLPSITPPNEWHRLHAFNWQKRGALAFVWDYEHGQIARLQVNLNSYTGKPTGQK